MLRTGGVPFCCLCVTDLDALPRCCCDERPPLSLPQVQAVKNGEVHSLIDEEGAEDL